MTTNRRLNLIIAQTLHYALGRSSPPIIIITIITNLLAPLSLIFGIWPTDLARKYLERDAKRIQHAAILGRSGGVRSRAWRRRHGMSHRGRGGVADDGG